MFYIIGWKRVNKKLKLLTDRRCNMGKINNNKSLEDDIRDDSELLENLRTISERSLPHEPKWVNGSNLVRDNAIIRRKTDPRCVS